MSHTYISKISKTMNIGGDYSFCGDKKPIPSTPPQGNRNPLKLPEMPPAKSNSSDFRTKSNSIAFMPADVSKKQLLERPPWRDLVHEWKAFNLLFKKDRDELNIKNLERVVDPFMRNVEDMHIL